MNDQEASLLAFFVVDGLRYSLDVGRGGRAGLMVSIVYAGHKRRFLHQNPDLPFLLVGRRNSDEAGVEIPEELLFKSKGQIYEACFWRRVERTNRELLVTDEVLEVADGMIVVETGWVKYSGVELE